MYIYKYEDGSTIETNDPFIKSSKHFQELVQKEIDMIIPEGFAFFSDFIDTNTISLLGHGNEIVFSVSGNSYWSTLENFIERLDEFTK